MLTPVLCLPPRGRGKRGPGPLRTPCGVAAPYPGAYLQDVKLGRLNLGPRFLQPCHRTEVHASCRDSGRVRTHSSGGGPCPIRPAHSQMMAIMELKFPMLKHSRATSMKNSSTRVRCFFFTTCGGQRLSIQFPLGAPRTSEAHTLGCGKGTGHRGAPVPSGTLGPGNGHPTFPSKVTSSTLRQVGQC